MQLEDELKLWGPEAMGEGEESPTLEFSQQYCRRLARSHYENFVVVGVFTPPRLRIAFEAVYGFCRWADDLGDETGSPEKSGQLLGWWQHQLEEVYRPGAPEPRHPVYVALKPVINQFQLPIKPFSDLISAFVQDQWKTRFTDHAELLELVARNLAAGGVVYFSTNFRRFHLAADRLEPRFTIREITNRTIPEDFRNDRIHRCWRLVAKGPV